MYATVITTHITTTETTETDPTSIAAPVATATTVTFTTRYTVTNEHINSQSRVVCANGGAVYSCVTGQYKSGKFCTGYSLMDTQTCDSTYPCLRVFFWNSRFF